MLNETQRREKEQAVYRAVLALLEQGNDLSALTVSRIAAAAGIGKGTVYEYFASKEEIVRGLTEYCVEEELARLGAALTPCQTLRAAEEAMVAYVNDLTQTRIAGYRIVARVLAHSAGPVPTAGAERPLEQLRELLQGLFDRLRAAGELAADTDPGYFFHVAAAAWMPYIIALTPCRECGNPPAPALVLERTKRMMEKALR